jgi:hypothetical protein
VGPEFFGQFPNGQILLITINYEYERRQGMVRGGYTLAQYDFQKTGLPQGLTHCLIGNLSLPALNFEQYLTLRR